MANERAREANNPVSGYAGNWNYVYDVWGNLTQVYRNGQLVYEARYDAFGNRVWAKVGTQQRYYLYEGDTLVAELDANGNLVAEYVWGLLGPIARVASDGTVQFYVLDGLGHVRALVGRVGNSWQVTDTYAYDSWGNPIARTGTTQQPFTWNGAYGYKYIPATGLYHVGAREYDPRTARWLQRDPIGMTAGDPNLYRYCFNNPLTWEDPSGLQIIIFVHGSFSNPNTFDKSFISEVKSTLGARGHVMFAWSGTSDYNEMLQDAQKFCEFVQSVKSKHPFEPIFVVAHSNGGNVTAAASALGAPIDLIVRLGSPLPTNDAAYWGIKGNAIIFNFYDPDDLVITHAALLKGAYPDPGACPWFDMNIPIEAGGPTTSHAAIKTKSVWDSQVAPYLSWVKWWWGTGAPLIP